MGKPIGWDNAIIINTKPTGWDAATPIDSAGGGSGVNIPGMSEVDAYQPGDSANVLGIARPILEYGGMTVGGLLGTPAGPAGNVTGAGLGYGAGKGIADFIEGKQPDTLGEGLLKGGKDVLRGAAMEAGGQVLGKGIEYGGKKLLTKDVEAAIDKGIEKGIEKAIRPSVAGKNTFSQAAKYKDRAREAVRTIAENKDNLQLTDEYGEVISGLPKNLKQFSQAVEQTKRSIYAEYDALATAAGGKGVEIDLKPILSELHKVANNRAISTMSPNTAKYVETIFHDMGKQGKFTVQEAQEAVQILNSRLDAFYRNPSATEASNSAVDALVSNNLRKLLDDAIDTAQGPSYQALKNKYGALKSIEKDVNRRAVVDARKNTKGLLDFADIYTAGELVRGMAGGPGAIAKAGTMAAMKEWYKHINNPNYIVKRMFEGVEKEMAKQEGVKAMYDQVGRATAYTFGNLMDR